MTRRLILATRNPGKVREIRCALGSLPLETLDLSAYPQVEEPEETGATFADNARHKALYYAKATGLWCLADDSGLEVDAICGQPGVYSARFAADQCPQGATRAVIDAANNRKLLAMLKDVPDERRTARFVCHLAMADPQRILLEASDKVEGRIGHEEQGHNGFGYDPLFYMPELNCTTAQLTQDQKNQISHRGKAVRRFVELLRELLKDTHAAKV
jgi:XTP/dITP diphosphohydrolase